MRFIGSKANLLCDIKSIVDNRCPNSKTFCDLFSGTANVARFFKSSFAIISNDLLHFSYSIQKALIENNVEPYFEGLAELGIKSPIDYFNGRIISLEDIEKEPFIIQNYSSGMEGTSYLTSLNALKIDYIRQVVESWYTKKLITTSEYYYLIACLIEAVPSVSNIAGTYGAFLKHWDKRALNNIKLQPLTVVDNRQKNKVHNEDANELIKSISGDILYIDPPYNARQYLPNYHLLETISKYDYPDIHGKTGLRQYKDARSQYCFKGKVLNSFYDLIQNAQFRYIIVSYSSEGLMSEKEIGDILLSIGKENTYNLVKIPYRKYKSKKSSVKNDLTEYLFFVEKGI